MYATQLYSQTVPLSMGRGREKAVGSDHGTEAKHIHQSHSDIYNDTPDHTTDHRPLSTTCYAGGQSMQSSNHA